MATKADPVAISVCLLGPPRIERDGEAVSVDTRKAIALLAYLAVTGRPAGRDSLAALLWPDADQSRGRAALRRTLSALNSALRGRGLRIEREVLALEPGEISFDVEAFRRSVAGGDIRSLRRAADIHGGEFLAGFALRDSPEFDEWQVATDEELRRELGSALERLSSALSDSDPDGALTYAKRRLALDPLHEPAHRSLMRLYARGGDRTSALRQYRECVAVLERELGVEPLEETTELYESIREDRIVEEPVPVALAVRVGPSPEPPLVGRATELRALTDAYESIGPGGQLVVIGGEQGIGKTRLAEEFISSVAQRGTAVLSARCHPEEARMAFGTAVELLRSALGENRLDGVRRDALVEASRLVPEFAPDAPSPAPLDSPAARRRLFDGVAAVLAAACAGPPAGLLFVDDVHWADESSRDLLRFLVRRLANSAMFVMLTWRTEEVPPANPLRRMLSDAMRAGTATGISLGRLSLPDVKDLLRATGERDELATTLFEETAGVPFFLAEYIRAGAIQPGTLPPGVRDLLESRLDSVSRGAVQVLTAAAVIGRAFAPDVVRETSGRSDEEVAVGLDELVAHGLVAESGGAYDFSHPKLREYVYESATLARRRLLHGRAAEALARGARRRPELAALAAHHYERAGREDEAAEHFMAAGDHARGVFANAEALTHYRSALALGHAHAAGLHESIGELLTLAGRYREAIDAYEKAAALGAPIASVGRKLGDVHHRLGDWEAAEAHYLEGLQAADPEAARERAQILADRSLNAHRRDRPEDAQELAALALTEAEAAGDPRSLAQAHNVAGILASHRGDAAEAGAHLEASLMAAEELNDTAAAAAALNNLALVRRTGGRHEDALALAERALELCARIGDRHREAALHSNVADALRALGRAEEAMYHLKASAAIFAEVGESDEPHPEIWKLVEW